jgi:hypothetical protein
MRLPRLLIAASAADLGLLNGFGWRFDALLG